MNISMYCVIHDHGKTYVRTALRTLEKLIISVTGQHFVSSCLASHIREISEIHAFKTNFS